MTDKLTYASYLELDQLLDRQHPRSDEHDEMLFIIIHQTAELWLKLTLHELSKIRADLLSGDLYGAIHGFKRVRMVLKTLVGQFDVLETLTPHAFRRFRPRLDEASGFQSHQFRQLEFILGHKRKAAIELQQPGSTGEAALSKRLHELSIVDAFYDFLEHHGVVIPPHLRHGDVSEPSQPSVEIQHDLLTLYRKQPSMAILFELMVDVDEGLQEWRYRHVKVVERIIGDQHGTGGSMGVAFLRETLDRPVFPDLWAIRSTL